MKVLDKGNVYVNVDPWWPTTTQLSAREWRNEVPVKWRVGNREGTVPVGFSTDFASTPRILWPIFPKQGVYSIAALVHDFLYKSNGRHVLMSPPVKALMSRKDADRTFLSLMELLGVEKWTRKMMYRAVRMFGGRQWAKHTVLKRRRFGGSPKPKD